MSDKTHGTVEEMAIRYDSYDHKDAYGETVLDGRLVVEVERVFNNYDEELTPLGTRVYFICPACLRRVRYLYARRKDGPAVCRKCWRLNYRSQQATKGSGMEVLRMKKAVEGMGITSYRNLLDVPIPVKRPRGISRKQFLTNRQRYYDALEQWYAHALAILGRLNKEK